ncbi:hypothetical protein [Allonocardiopsis opalescens]|uniref:PASTA domain-containing protein n=1 Tax=Allonocardiopsis opalescens TaxID=1144618 RepID=A0A2T0QDV2_9ACTN|nr:hypothetical protein [Allonocardiopsis opalescens]PRY02117.1 hypothetical protein CLV72_101717 [Allonocardiopsis opalescens]
MTSRDDQDRLVALLAPYRTHTAIAAADPEGDVAQELRTMIIDTPRPGTAPDVPQRRPSPWRRRLLIAVPAAAALTAGAFGATMLLPPADPGTAPIPVPVGPAPAQALEITEDGDYVEVRVVDPLADTERFTEELAAAGYDIELSLAPVEPSSVGTIVFMETGDVGGGRSIEIIEAPGECGSEYGGGIGPCDVGLRIPEEFDSYAHVVFGRAATAEEGGEGAPEGAEGFESDANPGDAPIVTPEQREVLNSLYGMTLGEARETVESHGWTYELRGMFDAENEAIEAGEVTDDWYVNDVATLAGGVVLLWVNEEDQHG